jgi:hypothetical protein
MAFTLTRKGKDSNAALPWQDRNKDPAHNRMNGSAALRLSLEIKILRRSSKQDSNDTGKKKPSKVPQPFRRVVGTRREIKRAGAADQEEKSRWAPATHSWSTGITHSEKKTS